MPDKPTAYSFDSKGILTARGIIKFELSGCTDEKIYLSKKAGLKHHKATSIIVDLSPTVHTCVLTGLFPAVINLVSCLSKENYPFEIKIVYGKMILPLQQIGTPFSLDQLISGFIKCFWGSYLDGSYTSSPTMLEAIKESAQVLRYYTTSKQKSIIILSNSLHLFRSPSLIG